MTEKHVGDVDAPDEGSAAIKAAPVRGAFSSPTESDTAAVAAAPSPSAPSPSATSAPASADKKKKSDLSRAFSEDGANKTHVGGQALLEGVMMRGRYNWSAAVRTPDGSIYIEEHDVASGKDKHAWMRWPVIRGCVSFVEGLVLGYKSLDVAAEHAYDEDGYTFYNMHEKAADMAKYEEKEAKKAAKKAEREAKRGRAVEPSASPSPSASSSSPEQTTQDSATSESGESQSVLSDGTMMVSMILGLVLGIALFIIVPAGLTNLIVGEYDTRTLLWNVVDGLLRVGVFVGYIWLIGRMKDIDHMFGYHGAEHKTIHCYEHGLELTPENARSFPRLHVRCGTAFLMIVMILAILVYTIIPVNSLISAWGVPDGAPKLILVILVRIIFLPLIAGFGYEITVKWAGSHPDNPVVKVILWPGMQMQYLTTREPDDSQLECAIAAMKVVLEREEAEAAKKAEEAVRVAASEMQPEGVAGASVAQE